MEPRIRPGEGGDGQALFWASSATCGQRVREELALEGGGGRVAGCCVSRRNESAAGRDDGFRWRLRGRCGGGSGGGCDVERSLRSADAPWWPQLPWLASRPW